MHLSVVIPTIPGREHWLERSIAAYESFTAAYYEIIVIRDQPTCGLAWQAGIEQSEGDYIHLSNDDIEPHEGWLEAAIATITQRAALPCPRVLNTDGSLQSCGDLIQEDPDGAVAHVARIPFLPRTLLADLGPLPEWHYMHDYWISWRAAQLGWPTVVSRGYLFTHHLAEEGRKTDGFAADLAAYEEMTK